MVNDNVATPVMFMRTASRLTSLAFSVLLASCASTKLAHVAECPKGVYPDQVPTQHYAPPKSCTNGAQGKTPSYCRVAGGLRQLDDVGFHLMVARPEALKDLQPPPNLLLLAFEKPTAGFVGKSSWEVDPYTFEGPQPEKLSIGFNAATERKRWRDLQREIKGPNLFTLTHAVRIENGAGLSVNGGAQNSCLTFSVYGASTGEAPPFACSGSTMSDVSDGASIVASALRYLRDDQPKVLAEMIHRTKPTHLLVMSTGWNTSQAESIFNYGEWYRAIARAADGEAFRPLILGFSWQSTWDNILGGALISGINKGNDADELGAGWVNLAVQQAIDAARNAKIPVILVGHSYGVRVLGHSVFAPFLAERPADGAPDAFIGFSAAAPISRLNPDGGEPYWADATKTLVLFTGSVNDTATSAPPWNYLGGAGALKKVRKGGYGVLRPIQGNADGRLGRVPNPGEVLLADLSATVTCEKPGTGGGAHSDVFDDQAGRLIWQVIKSVEVDQPPVHSPTAAVEQPR